MSEAVLAAFSVPWWNVGTATMWVSARDRQLTDDMHVRGDGSGIHLAVTLAFANQTRDFRERIDSHAARVALFEAMQAGAIRAIGNDFEQRSDKIGRAVHVHPTTREISDIELTSLEFFENEGEDVLVHVDWRVSRGSDFANLRGIKDIRLRREDVMATFPADDAPPPPVIVPMPIERLAPGQIKAMKMPEYLDAYEQFVVANAGLQRIGKLDIEHMQASFPEISQRTVMELRSQRGLAQWSKQGRDPKK